jgi:hypothetical protein
LFFFPSFIIQLHFCFPFLFFSWVSFQGVLEFCPIPVYTYLAPPPLHIFKKKNLSQYIYVHTYLIPAKNEFWGPFFMHQTCM